jgi:ATP-dependent RNA helicase RhlE
VRGLVRAGIAAQAIHGNKSQNQRDRVLADFRKGEVRTLVATDIAARGIDVDGISHVVNFDLPNVPETYVHRIGRTARAGANGVAISLCDSQEAALLRDIEKLIRMRIPAADHSSLPRPARRPADHSRANGSASHELGKRRQPRRDDISRRQFEASSHGKLREALPRSRVAVAIPAILGAPNRTIRPAKIQGQ